MVALMAKITDQIQEGTLQSEYSNNLVHGFIL